INSKKEYFCKYCDEGPFEKPWQVAAHTKKCPIANKESNMSGLFCINSIAN
ncbi:unnamed protein product, partial [marine sediment metagenome]